MCQPRPPPLSSCAFGCLGPVYHLLPSLSAREAEEEISTQLGLRVEVTDGKNQFSKSLCSLWDSGNGHGGGVLAPGVLINLRGTVLWSVLFPDCLIFAPLINCRVQTKAGSKTGLPSLSSASDFHWNLSLHLVYVFECSLQTQQHQIWPLKKEAMCNFCSTSFCLIEYFLK